jgi:hypothetical protein
MIFFLLLMFRIAREPLAYQLEQVKDRLIWNMIRLALHPMSRPIARGTFSKLSFETHRQTGYMIEAPCSVEGVF